MQAVFLKNEPPMRKDAMLKSLLYLLLYVLVLCSCCPCKNIGSEVEREKKDSTWTKVETRWRDTVITTPVDSAAIKALVICPEGGVINMPELISKTNRATAKAKIVNNQLRVSCKCDGLELRLKLRDITIEKYRLALDRSSELKIRSEKYIPRWVKILACIGAGLALYHAIRLAFKIYKTLI